jgi:hypothetical protein
MSSGSGRREKLQFRFKTFPFRALAFNTFRGGLWWLGCTVVWLAGNDLELAAQVPGNGPASVTASSNPESANLNALLKGLVLDAIPHTYQKWDDWGRQADQFAGVAWRRDPGGKLETKRQWVKVNDGIWRMYSAELVDPAQTFEVKLEHLREDKPGSVAFDLSFVAALNLRARQAQWIRGVQLYSFSAEGSARVRLRVGCVLASQLDLKQLPPVIQLKPVVREANLELEDFRIDRVSKLGGEFAQQITAAVRGELDEQLHKKSNDLVGRLNERLVKDEPKLRISLSDAAKLPWTPQAKPFLPSDVQEALGK